MYLMFKTIESICQVAKKGHNKPIYILLLGIGHPDKIKVTHWIANCGLEATVLTRLKLVVG